MSVLPNLWRASCSPLLVLLLLAAQRGFCALTDIERDFIEVPSPDSARESLQFITSKPHVAGTPGDHEMAQYVHDRFASAGVPHVEIQPVDALLSNPISSSLQLVDTTTAAGSDSAVVFTAQLSEDVLDLDTTSDTWFRNHTYNGYSPSGDVTAPLVYANYGRPEDFDALEAAGVSVEGTIVITRYGMCFRGLKAMNAQTRGALGTIIYSDPEQDGFKKGPTYPDGGFRPSSSVQRGSAVFTSLCAGDPARAASAKPVEEICGFSQEELIPSIPVMPISYGDAEPLLRAMEGAPAPEGFQGGLDFSYTVGPSGSAAAVRLVVENEAHVGPIWNVIGTIPGSLPEEEDRPIIIGNHRDAWVFGAVDPNSGTASLIEVARGLGVLLKGGWRPQRTIVLCSWSGEELGMLGSTAWGEENAEGILAKAAAYLNVDSAVSGKVLRVKATPSLGGLVSGALGDVEDPASGGTLLEAWSGELQMLGSGSDYAVFLDHLGIATVDFEFQEDAEAEYGVYHSIYDSFSWVDTYGDPGFRYFQAAARFWGLMTLRLATPDILPFNPTTQAAALEEYVAALSPAATAAAAAAAAGEKESAVTAATATASLLSEDDLAPLREAVAAFRAAADAVGASVEAYTNVRTIPVSAAAEARAVLLRGAERFQARRRRSGAPGGHGVIGSSGDGSGGVEGREGDSKIAPSSASGGGSAEDLNERLAMTERRFLSEEGLPGRKWFRHVLQAPGLYLGYAAESFPGITQALRDGDEALARAQVAVASGCINDAADFLSGGSGSGAPQGAVGRGAAGAAEP